MSPNSSERPTHLYRAYDNDGQLIYVGIAYNWTARWEKHQQRSHWFPQVTRVDVEQHATRALAQEAERAAIQDEHPLHNIEHTSRDKRPWVLNRTELHVTPFDHRAMLRYDKYQAAYKAINELARAEAIDGTQETLVRVVAEMARSVPYGDWCAKCRNDEGDPTAYPAAIEMTSKTSIKANYWHYRCGHSWSTWWAIDAPLYV